MNTPLLRVENLARQYRKGTFRKTTTFSLTANFEVAEPSIVGVMGPNGSGKTTLFEMITGSNLPSAGRVLINGQDIHQVRTKERDRLAIHYHQSYQGVHFRKRSRTSCWLTRVAIHLWCISLTNRSSIRKTATLVSCSISS